MTGQSWYHMFVARVTRKDWDTKSRLKVEKQHWCTFFKLVPWRRTPKLADCAVSSAASSCARPPQQLSCATEMDEDVEFSHLPAEIWGRVTSRSGFGCLRGWSSVPMKETPEVPIFMGDTFAFPSVLEFW